MTAAREIKASSIVVEDKLRGYSTIILSDGSMLRVMNGELLEVEDWSYNGPPRTVKELEVLLRS
jgi:hypothetical protein